MKATKLKLCTRETEAAFGNALELVYADVLQKESQSLIRFINLLKSIENEPDPEKRSQLEDKLEVERKINDDVTLLLFLLQDYYGIEDDWS